MGNPIYLLFLTNKATRCQSHASNLICSFLFLHYIIVFMTFFSNVRSKQEMLRGCIDAPLTRHTLDLLLHCDLVRLHLLHRAYWVPSALGQLTGRYDGLHKQHVLYWHRSYNFQTGVSSVQLSVLTFELSAYSEQLPSRQQYRFYLSAGRPYTTIHLVGVLLNIDKSAGRPYTTMHLAGVLIDTTLKKKNQRFWWSNPQSVH